MLISGGRRVTWPHHLDQSTTTKTMTGLLEQHQHSAGALCRRRMVALGGARRRQRCSEHGRVSCPSLPLDKSCSWSSHCACPLSSITSTGESWAVRAQSLASVANDTELLMTAFNRIALSFSRPEKLLINVGEPLNERRSAGETSLIPSSIPTSA